MINRCAFPACILEEHETGEHKFGRPQKPCGTLRLVSEFVYSRFRCETCPDYKGMPLHVAEGFYVDELGFGWALCVPCAIAHRVKEPEPLTMKTLNLTCIRGGRKAARL